jgi:DNA-binding GntR family transcriptional regulator
MAGRLAARRITDAEAASLRVAHAACGAARGDADSYYAVNEQFHQAIYAASGNAFLAEQSSGLQKRLRPYRRLQLRVRNRVTTSYAEHETIVNAILAGDGERASAELRAHVRVQGERFSDLVASLTRLGAA